MVVHSRWIFGHYYRNPQPIKNADPLARARAENSIKITAIMGTGLMAIPMARGMVAPIAPSISSPHLLDHTCCASDPSDCPEFSPVLAANSSSWAQLMYLVRRNAMRIEGDVDP